MPDDRTPIAVSEMAREDPELAARLAIQALPAAAARIPGRLDYAMAVDGLGAWRVAVDNGRASVTPIEDGEAEDNLDFRLEMDPQALAELAAGAGPLGLMLSGRMRIRGKRRRALRLRALSEAQPSMSEIVRSGGDVDPDLAYRSLPYLIDPEWTRGHSFVLASEIDDRRWYVHVNDGERIRVTTEPPAAGPDCTLRMPGDVYRALVAGELRPTDASRRQLSQMDGKMFFGTLLGRWIDRAQGGDDAELERERLQREVQERRAGSWGADGASPGQGDPAHEAEGARRRAGGGLLTYHELYALWERQNWRASEIDFSVDREHWLASPTDAQRDTTWSLASFYIGEERVTATLGPFLSAAPSGEIEVFLATQLVDEARHTAMFDRFGAEVMALSAEDLRGRIGELEEMMLSPWRELFDGELREVASRLKARPDDLDLFVDGIVTYHMVIEGVLAMTGQHLIGSYMADHDLYPGFRQGFSLVERDEHRHIAFGVRFLKEAVEQEPRYRERIETLVAELVPRACHVFVPPYADSAEEFVSYGYDSRQIYGFAYRALKRRMGVIGLEVPPAVELMPGPIEEQAEEPVAG